MTDSQAVLLLKKQLAGGSFARMVRLAVTFILIELRKRPVDGFSAGLIDDNDIFRWAIMIIGPRDTL